MNSFSWINPASSLHFLNRWMISGFTNKWKPSCKMIQQVLISTRCSAVGEILPGGEMMRVHSNVAKMADLSWCRCRSWPGCPPAAPGRRARTSRATAPSAGAAAWRRCCCAAGACRSPTRRRGPAAGCASSWAALLREQRTAWGDAMLSTCRGRRQAAGGAEAPRWMVKLSSSSGCSSNGLQPPSAASASRPGCTLISSLQNTNQSKSSFTVARPSAQNQPGSTAGSGSKMEEKRFLTFRPVLLQASAYFTREQPDKILVLTDSLDFAAVVGFLQILVQLDDPVLVLLLLDGRHLLQLARPPVLQHLQRERGQDDVSSEWTSSQDDVSSEWMCLSCCLPAEHQSVVKPRRWHRGRSACFPAHASLCPSLLPAWRRRTDGGQTEDRRSSHCLRRKPVAPR